MKAKANVVCSRRLRSSAISKNMHFSGVSNVGGQTIENVRVQDPPVFALGVIHLTPEFRRGQKRAGGRNSDGGESKSDCTRLSEMPRSCVQQIFQQSKHVFWSMTRLQTNCQHVNKMLGPFIRDNAKPTNPCKSNLPTFQYNISALGSSWKPSLLFREPS